MIELPGESRYVTVDGIDTHYVVAGEGPPLLLFHGLGASVVTWRDNIGPLSNAFQVYAVDLPGHGDTGKPDFDYAADAIVEFIQGLLPSSQPRPAGNHRLIGGALGLMTALRYLEFVSSLVLVSSAALGKKVSIYLRLVTLPILGDLLESSRVGGTRFMLYKVFHDRRFATEELVEELFRSRRMPGAKEAVVRVLRNTVNILGVRKEYVLVDNLASLKLSVMVVWGSQDQTIPVSHAYRASEAAAHVRLQVYDQCGHWPHMEKASEFNSLVLEFLAR